MADDCTCKIHPLDCPQKDCRLYWHQYGWREPTSGCPVHDPEDATSQPPDRQEKTVGLLEHLGATIRSVNMANGWKVPVPKDWDDQNRIPTFLALIHSEVSEALEGFRHGDRENVAEELADVLIRVVDLAEGLGIDLDREVNAKIQKNQERGYRHGGKAI